MRKWFFVVIAGVLAGLVNNTQVYAGAAVPEIDGGTAVTALSVLTGLVALAAERLRRRR